MAATFAARRRAHFAQTDRLLLADHARLASAIGALIAGAASGRTPTGARVVPNTRRTRDALNAAVWSQVLRPYYLGPTGEALRGTQPQSPYAARLVAGVTGAVRIEAQAQIALIRSLIRSQAVIAWLTEPVSPTPRLRRLPGPGADVGPSEPQASSQVMPSFTQWVDPRGFVLADRILRMAVEVRSRVGRFLDYHIGGATGIEGMVAAAGRFLTTGERERRPYGQQGAYPARRLLRNEVVVARGWATINASRVNPVVKGLQWKLNRLDTDADKCDQNSRGGPNGDGVYPFGYNFPVYPDHPGEQCDVLAVRITDPARVEQALAYEIQYKTDYALNLHGAFNEDLLTNRLVGEEFVTAAYTVVGAF